MVANPEGDDDCFSENMDYKQQYKTLKRKLKFLIYENECFQEALKTTQRKLLKASRDKSFLLDRLLAYEKVEVSSSDDDDTDSSDNGEPPRDIKRKKMDHGAHVYGGMSSSSNSSKALPAKKKRLPQRPPKQNTVPQLSSLLSSEGGIGDGHMTPEEVERHLESQQGHMELIPSKVPSTVPPDLFSNEPSFDDSELNEVYCELETSPSNIADECLTVDMMPD